MSDTQAVWTEADQARADLIAEIACEISEDEGVVAMALDAYDARRSPIEAAASELYEALTRTLRAMVDDWAGNPVYDRAEIVSAARAALAKVSQQQGTPE